MKIKDLVFFVGLLLIASILIFKSSRVVFLDLTEHNPYLMGFVKVAILATMGELLAARILNHQYIIKGLLYKFIIWGFIGCSFVLVFELFASGVKSLQDKYLLPSVIDEGMNTILLAFFTSTLMNLFFAPTFMAFHRITDTFIELGEGKIRKIIMVKKEHVLNNINWNHFIQFIVLKTIPLFWIPAHTITFLLPKNYRVFMAASLSIALGVILSFAKKRSVVR